MCNVAQLYASPSGAGALTLRPPRASASLPNARCGPIPTAPGRLCALRVRQHEVPARPRDVAPIDNRCQELEHPAATPRESLSRSAFALETVIGDFDFLAAERRYRAMDFLRACSPQRLRLGPRSHRFCPQGESRKTQTEARRHRGTGENPGTRVGRSGTCDVVFVRLYILTSCR